MKILSLLFPFHWHAALLLASGMFALCLPLAATAADIPKVVKLNTSAGDIVLELYPDKAPKSVENFLQYVRDKHYDGTVFHRVMDGFMIQGGGFTADLQQKSTRAPISLEASNGLKNDRGTVAMARTANPNSATAQFFINLVNNASLNAPNPDGHGYAVFGKVVIGMDVVNKIKGVAVGDQGPHQNVPKQPIIIISANSLTFELLPSQEQEYSLLPLSGKSDVTGQAFLKTRGGDIKFAAGEKVYLEPVTEFSTQWYEVQSARPLPLTTSNSKASKYSKVTTADATGKFNFSGIPAGAYFLITKVTWEVANNTQGGTIFKRISIKEGEKLNAILSD
jgi:peptidyl-prolyl cis-trans isomerase A (cyclophilin A)